MWRNGSEKKVIPVVIKLSFGASGSQARAVIAGQQADVVSLSLAPDITSIQKAGLINPGWERELENGVLSYIAC